MRLRLTKIGTHPTLAYATEELSRYIHLMDNRFPVDEFTCESYEEVQNDTCETVAIGVGLGVACGEEDHIRVSVQNGNGVITGSNPRSVLFAVYRFLYALGCRFPTPEDDGDVIPQRKLSLADITAELDETPSYRHRGIVLEGSLDYTQAKNMIKWMPKLGLNEYFIQYLVPRQYFWRVYKHYGETLTEAETLRMQARLVEEIKKRDLIYHAVGHTWQCVPFGIEGSYGKKGVSVPEASRKYLALVNGKRGLFDDNPLATEVCYSDKEARDIMIRAAVDYCKAHPEVDYLHFWQSDATNNCCECEKCRDKTMADLYIPLLNELDEAFEKEGIDAKIVFLCYTNLTWAPLVERLKNEDRFVFMATIAHSYSKPINHMERVPSPQPYRLNQNEVPRNNEDSIAMVKKWQEVFKGDSFLFDYNQIWDHYKDPGYMHCAARIAGDNRLLRELGMNGLHSCQFTQVGSPTWLPTYTHGVSMWNNRLDFADIAKEYFTAVFGESAEAAETWLQKMSDDFDPPYLRHEKEEIDADARVRYERLAREITEKLPELKALAETCEPWKKIYCHARLDALLAEGLCARAAGDAEGAAQKAEEIRELAFSMYEETFGSLDTKFYVSIIKSVLTAEQTTFARVVQTKR
ncbi:MAG: DUF4838 domain-containing protein [Ruminococcaceae bacterium]|nr:DUF4838 domain-containing protein [Oscillospiraceae bacterium]